GSGPRDARLLRRVRLACRHRRGLPRAAAVRARLRASGPDLHARAPRRADPLQPSREHVPAPRAADDAPVRTHRAVARRVSDSPAARAEALPLVPGPAGAEALAPLGPVVPRVPPARDRAPARGAGGGARAVVPAPGPPPPALAALSAAAPGCLFWAPAPPRSGRRDAPRPSGRGSSPPSRSHTVGYGRSSGCGRVVRKVLHGSAMRILLTGSRGYIGTVMAPMMAQAGHDVVGLDTDLYRRSTFGPSAHSI